MRVRRCWFHRWSEWSAYRLPNSTERHMIKRCVKCARGKRRIYRQKETA